MIESWGRYPRAVHATQPLEWRHEIPRFETGRRYLAHGLGRSYGDVCLNDGGVALASRGLRKVVAFDRDAGVLRAEAGMSLDEVLALVVPAGWFIPVSPGTRFVTLGGAVANDVHGKNHHVAGTFGCHVRRLELVRSNGERIECSPAEHRELFEATVAGLGLTGLMTWIEIQLIPIRSGWIECETTPFHDIQEFLDVSKASDALFDYTVSWIDCLSRGKEAGRGIFFRGRHADPRPGRRVFWAPPTPLLRVPFDAPRIALNRLTVSTFNTVYFNKHRLTSGMGYQPYHKFFYPLDSVVGWNRLYGRRGFLQFQMVVPEIHPGGALSAVLSEIQGAQNPSFLAVLKRFGSIRSPGLMSFPREGLTLTLDFPIRGTWTFDLMRRLHAIVREAGGRIYSAKDACMSPAEFREYYPNLPQFAKHIDPAFSSSFWRRVTSE